MPIVKGGEATRMEVCGAAGLGLRFQGEAGWLVGARVCRAHPLSSPLREGGQVGSGRPGS